jgi:hypothetical protein
MQRQKSAYRHEGQLQVGKVVADSRKGVGGRLTTSHPRETACYEMFETIFKLDELFGIKPQIQKDN